MKNPKTPAAPKKKKTLRKNIIDRLADMPYPPIEDDAPHDPYAPVPHSDAINLLALERDMPAPKSEPILCNDDDDDGLTGEQRLQRYIATCKPAELDRYPADTLARKCFSRRVWRGIGCHEHTLVKPIIRDTTHGPYRGTIEQFHTRAHAVATEAQADSKVVEMLVNTQPHRKAFALLQEGQQPLPTFGPMQLPQSYDPVADPDKNPEPEKRPTHWQPGTPISDILYGIVTDLANTTTALAARLTVGIGHQPDIESVSTLRTLIRSASVLQRIVHTEEDRQEQKQQDKKSKNTGGRPRKLRLPDTDQVVTLRLELIQKNKKHGNRKSSLVTKEESTLELAKTPEQIGSPITAETSNIELAKTSEEQPATSVAKPQIPNFGKHDLESPGSTAPANVSCYGCAVDTPISTNDVAAFVDTTGSLKAQVVGSGDKNGC